MPILEWSPSVFSFVVETGGKHFLVLQEEGLENVKSTSLKSLARENSVEALLAPQDIFPEEQKLPGKSFVLFGSQGEVCRATVGAVVAIARADGTDFIADDFDYDTAPASKFASAIWENGQRMRVARLESTGECSGALWARAESERSPNLLARFEPGEDTKAQIQKQFKALPGYKRVQAEYATYLKEMSGDNDESAKIPDWGEVEDISREITGFRDAVTGREFIQIAVQGDTGCGAANTEFWAIFAKRDAGLWEVVTNPDQPGGVFSAVLAVDANLDGHPEFVGTGMFTSYGQDEDRQIVEIKDKTYTQTRSTIFPFLGCRC
jgi:hypothetical protein